MPPGARLPVPATQHAARSTQHAALRTPLLCLVTDRTACLGRSVQEVVAAAVEAGVGLVQLREKDLSARRLLELGRQLLEPVRAGGAALVVNDRLDVALALGADGVHLGGGSLPVGEVRRLVGGEMLVGASVHSVEEAVRAEEAGADYLVLGTIFETRSHPEGRPAGPDLVARAARAVKVPLLGIGGIDARNAPSVMAAGAAGVAVIRAIQAAEDVAGATRSLLEAMMGELGGTGGTRGSQRASGGSQGVSGVSPLIIDETG